MRPPSSDVLVLDPLTQVLSADWQHYQQHIRPFHRLTHFFPDEGPCRRELYPKHLEFFAAGKRYKERLFMAANRVGKSESGAYELACHLTGDYPAWWEGRRFDAPIEAWACGTTSETARDIVQAKLLGPVGALGTGMLPRDRISHTVPRRSGIAGSIETVWVRHRRGTSTLGLKTYEQGRKSYEGTARHVIWMDEEPPLDIYTEALYRTTTTRGILLTTFTPLQGMSDVVKSFLEPEREEQKEFKFYVQAGWAHVPHIPEEEKRALLATTPAYEIKARTLGEPSLGAGAIYPIAESDIVVPDRAIPDEWPRCYALDVGWRRTAALWLAQDQGSGILYLYSEHYQAAGEPASHALAIKGRGDWIPGVIDPAARGRSQNDGRKLIESYKELGLDLEPANNAVYAGLSDTWQLLVSGRLKVMASLHNFLSEFRKYHRDEKGTIVKTDDHLMDCLRYAVMSGRDRMKVKPRPKQPDTQMYGVDRRGNFGNQGGWMG